MEEALQNARQIIDETDRLMASLFEKRMNAVKLVAEYKKSHGLLITDPIRETEMLARNAEYISDPALREDYKRFLSDTMKTSRNYQRRLLEGMTVAYAGTEGAFAHIAANKLYPTARKKSYGDFAGAYNAVVSGECDVCVLPLENSSAGEVGQVTDLLFGGPLYINGTYELSVTHDLVGVHGTKEDDIKTVVSHPQALMQCDSYIREHNLDKQSASNTALAAKYVAEKGDKTVAAIASGETAKLYGLKVIRDSINTSDSNTTRFAVLSLNDNKGAVAAHGTSFALMFTVKNEAGALAQALNIIGYHGYNLRTLRSRPRKDLLWRYCFYAEAEGDIYGDNGTNLIEELGVCCDRIKILGEFKKLSPADETEN
jgi:chorismate mutase / prephenate dehydratase